MTSSQQIRAENMNPKPYNWIKCLDTSYIYMLKGIPCENGKKLLVENKGHMAFCLNPKCEVEEVFAK